jgi:hypothetical protein
MGDASKARDFHSKHIDMIPIQDEYCYAPCSIAICGLHIARSSTAITTAGAGDSK